MRVLRGKNVVYPFFPHDFVALVVAPLPVTGTGPLVGRLGALSAAAAAAAAAAAVGVIEAAPEAADGAAAADADARGLARADDVVDGGMGEAFRLHRPLPTPYVSLMTAFQMYSVATLSNSRVTRA